MFCDELCLLIENCKRRILHQKAKSFLTFPQTSSTQSNITPITPNDESVIPSLPPEVDFSTAQQKRQQKENSESELKEIENLKNSFREFSKFLNGIAVNNMDET